MPIVTKLMPTGVLKLCLPPAEVPGCMWKPFDAPPERVVALVAQNLQNGRP